MNEKKPLAIVLGITDNWAFAAATVLLGLQEHKLKHDYNIIIYHQNLSDKNRLLLQQIHPCVFVDYEVDLINTEKFSRVSKMAFSRYECFGLLEKYKKVLWLDSDILIKGDISGLIDSCASGIAMYKHEGIPMSVSFSLPVLGFDMTKVCFNTGILLLTDSLDNVEALREWCYEKTNEWSNEINSDQAIINLLLQAFDLSVSELDIRYNCPPNMESTETLILHPWGENKFWNGLVHPLWEKYFLQWRALGGNGPVIQRGPLSGLTTLHMLHKKLTLRSELYKWLIQYLKSYIAKLKRLFK